MQGTSEAAMPTIDYYGHLLTIDTAHSYDRVSSRQQRPEKGGEGINRQARLRQEFSEQFGVPIDYELNDVRSASDDKYLEDGGVLAGFMAIATGKMKGKTLGRNPALLVESFSRLCRLVIDDALFLFLTIIRSGVTLITLADKRAYTQTSLRNNPGEIHIVAAHLQSARAEAEARGYFSRTSWVARRDKVIKMCPGWMLPNADRTAYDPKEGAKEIFCRMFREGEHLGDEKIAARFNEEGIKPFAVWNHTSTVWYGNHIRRLITGRTVRGEREVWQYNGATRTKTRKVIYIYPEMVSEEQWQRTNAARAARQQQIPAGRKGDDFPNLFQSLAKCAHCKKAMKLSSTRKRGKLYQYYRCSNVRRRACDRPHTYDYANVEAEFIEVFQDIVAAYLVGAEPRNDTATPIRENIAVKQAELLSLDDEAKHIRSTLHDAAKKARKTRADVESAFELFGFADKKAELLGEITALERKIAQMKAQAPAEHVAKYCVS
jgi:hypothetical protein